MNSLADGEN